jgi:hypothetical protein
VCGIYFRWSVSHALYRLACKLLALSVLVSPLREQSPSIRVRYGTPSGAITGPSLSRAVPSLQRAYTALQLTITSSQVCYVTFVKLGVGSNAGTFHNSLVVSKHVALATDGNSEVPERQSQVHDIAQHKCEQPHISIHTLQLF